MTGQTQSADKLRRVGDAYGIPARSRYGCDRFAQIASNRDVDAVYIVLPSGLHAGWTEHAFAGRKHLPCEKPMDVVPTAADVRSTAPRIRKITRHRDRRDPFRAPATP